MRGVDTEYKIPSDIQKQIGNNYTIKCSIKLYTELEPCKSCVYVIEQFGQMYPNIDIEIIYSVGK